MKNAHLRFGWLTYNKRTELTTTHFKVHLDRFVGEVNSAPPRRAQAHLVSAIGSDTQIAAIGAAMSMEEEFTTGDHTVEISDEDAEKIVTVQDAVDYIKDHGVEDE